MPKQNDKNKTDKQLYLEFRYTFFRLGLRNASFPSETSLYQSDKICINSKIIQVICTDIRQSFDASL